MKIPLLSILKWIFNSILFVLRLVSNLLQSILIIAVIVIVGALPILGMVYTGTSHLSAYDVSNWFETTGLPDWAEPVIWRIILLTRIDSMSDISEWVEMINPLD